MPLTNIQTDILRLLAAHRNPESYVAGATALNRDAPRYSGDIDIFHDREERVSSAALTDAKTLEAAGYRVTWLRQLPAIYTAEVRRDATATRLEWVADSDFRYFPALRDDTFGYLLHPVDLATNKVMAAAGRREVRDLVDLVTIHDTILPLGAVVWAAAEKSPGFTPEGVIAEIRRNANYPASEWNALQTSHPLDPKAIMARLRAVLDDAEAFVSRMPTDAAGLLFLRGSEVVQPDPDRLQDYHTHAGQRRGQWPSNTEITAAMFERAALEKAYQPGLTIRVEDATLEQQRQRHAHDSQRPPASPQQAAPPPLTPASEAMLRQIAERERKRLQVIRTPTVRRFEARDQGMVRFGAVEQIEGKHVALLHRQDETVVLSIDEVTYTRLISVKRGHAIRVSSTGSLTLGRGRRR